MGKTYKLYKLFWLLFTLCCWAAFFYLAAHRSAHADIFARYSYKYFAILCVFFLIAGAVSVGNLNFIFLRLYNLRKAFILLVASTLFSVLLVEGFVRIIDFQGISYYAELTRYDLDKLPDEDLIYKHRSSWNAVYQGVECRFNEFGLRDEPILPKQQDELRILLLGDSVVFGWGVEQDKTFSYQLQDILEKNLEVTVRVINSGVGSYNTTQEHAFLLKHGLAFNPDLILLLYVPNDVTIHPAEFNPRKQLSYQGKSPPQVLHMMLKKSWLWRLIWHAFKYGGLGPVRDQKAVFISDAPGVKRSMASLKGILSTCQKRNIPVGLFYFNWATKPTDDLLALLEKKISPLEITHVGKWFDGKNIRHYINTVVDSHPNADAHTIIAENMAQYLLSHHVFLDD